VSDAAFGPLVTGAHVERWALATLQEWHREYLAWAERASGLKARALPLPRAWVTSSDFERWPEEQTPCVLLLSTGLASEPTRDGRTRHHAKFSLGLAVVVEARDQATTDELAKLYVATFRTLLLQHQSLGGHAEGVEWVDEQYDVLPARGRRQLAAGQAVFRVDVRNVVTGRTGPQAPRPDPYPPLPDPPTVASTDVEVDPKGLPGSSGD